jgi:hypothetical protein
MLGIDAMSMSTNVVGFRPPDEKWKALKLIWDACEASGIEAPIEVQKFFEYETPDDHGKEIDLGSALTKWSNDSADGYEIDVKKLPKDLTVIRFYNSW